MRMKADVYVAKLMCRGVEGYKLSASINSVVKMDPQD